MVAQSRDLLSPADAHPSINPDSDEIKWIRSLLRELNARREIDARGGQIYAHVVDGIPRLRQDYKIFLVSNCQKWYLDAFFKHSQLRDLFDDVLCLGESGRTKKDNISEMVRRNALKNAVYIGDTHWDQEAAFYSGVKFIFY